MAVPDRPDPDDIVASAWGQWVHDKLLAANGFTVWAGRVPLSTNTFGDCSLTKPATIGTVVAAIAAPVYDTNGFTFLHRNGDLSWKLRKVDGNTVAVYTFTADIIVIGTAATP